MTQLRTPPPSIRERLEELNSRAEHLEQQLMQSQRLATLGTLSMSVAHEFNNLLMTIINRADSALTSDREDQMRKALEKTVTCGEQASAMIRNMLGFASANADQRQRLTAARLMDEAVALLGRDPAKDGIVLERRYDESLTVEVSPVEITQVLLNLLLNARQAMNGRRGGKLRLGVSRRDETVVLEVADSGHGIPPEHLEKIFEPFFTTKKSSGTEGGTGLGLYLARKIVAAHGGDIAVKSQLGQGATFEVQLPG